MGAAKYSVEQEKQIVEEYRQGISVEVLCQKYGYKGKKSIMDKVKKYHPDDYQEIIKEAQQNRKTWSLSLERIKSNFDAYLIGLLLTDGYVGDRGVGLDLIDEDCIAFISKQTKKNYHTYDYSDNDKAFDKYDRKPRHRILFNDNILIQQLERFGITRNKTLNLQPPQLFDEEYQFLPYLIRGIIDGDGCVFENSNNKKINIYIVTASKVFAEWVAKMLRERLFLQGVAINEKTKANDTDAQLYKVEIYRENDIKKIAALVYDEPFGMERKFAKIDAQRL